MEIGEVFRNIDQFFAENKAKEAEKYMLKTLEDARAKKEEHLVLPLLNELIGYYRQTSEKEPLRKVIAQAVEYAGNVDRISYGTTLLNAATGLRSIGELKEAESFYAKVEEIYEKELAESDMRKAGFYNNISLLYEEQGEFSKATAYQKKALSIALANEAGFEIAVSYANLANSTLGSGLLDEALQYANEAIKRFRAQNILDNHYGAALYALGMCYSNTGQYKKAMECFKEGMQIVEELLGHNAQYERLREGLLNCEEKMQGDTMERGIDICKKYYETYGIPMIREYFPEYEERIAVGLVGEGSDCFGYDDHFSMDHDWGPDFCMWLDDETYERIGDELQKRYDELPKEFMGYKRVVTATGKNRRGVLTIDGFYEHFLGTRDYEHIDYTKVEDYALAACTNGWVFADPLGRFSHIRGILKQGYPENVRLLKIAESGTRFAQCGQYNYKRMLERGDEMTANRMVSNAMYEAMKLLHYIENVYPPHEKWMRRSTQDLKRGGELLVLLNEAPKANGTEKTLEGIGEFFARIMYADHLISDVDSYLASHAEELVMKSSYVQMSDEELVNTIAKVEFEAFDKVHNEGGRASCQDDWPTFSVMRKSQYLTWNRTMLIQYLYDFNREYRLGHNLITEKYGRMMESTAPGEYAGLCDKFPPISPEKKGVIEQIIAIQMTMMEAFAAEYPNVTQNARSLHTYEDNYVNTSYETYLRGEVSTYSDKMLQLYGAYVVEHARNGQNIAREIIGNTALLYGFKTLDEFEKSAK